MDTTSKFFTSDDISNDIKTINKSLEITNDNSNDTTFIKHAITSGFLTPLRKTRPQSNLKLKNGLPASVYFVTMLLTLDRVNDFAYDSYLTSITGFSPEKNKRLITWIRNSNSYKFQTEANAFDAVHLFLQFMNKLCADLPNFSSAKNISEVQLLHRSIINFEWLNFLQLILSIPELTSFLYIPYDNLPNDLKAAVVFSQLSLLAPSFNETGPSTDVDFEHIAKIMNLFKNFSDYTNPENLIMENLIIDDTDCDFIRAPYKIFHDNVTRPINDQTGLFYCYDPNEIYLGTLSPTETYDWLTVQDRYNPHTGFQPKTKQLRYNPLTLWLNYEF